MPVDSDFTGYRITVARGTGVAEYSLTGIDLVVSAAELASLGSGPITISARQAGAIGLSRPATIIINA